MKNILFLIVLLCVLNVAAQHEANTQHKNILNKIDDNSRNNSPEKKSFLMTDEGTNNPENTGSTKKIINGKVYYVKEEQYIKIEFVPKQ